jgi:hypothetical protein
MMVKPEKFQIALLMVLLNVSLWGCAHDNELVHKDAQKKDARNIDCRSCHSPYGSEEARDFSLIYDNPFSHHSVGTSYPLGSNAFPNFNPPNSYIPSGSNTDIFFFDKNDNHQPDSDEIQLYGTEVRVTVECSSCHKEHGDLSVPETPRNAYLRIANIGSTLCMTCHRQ